MLHFDLKANGKIVGQVRIYRTGPVPADGVSVYDVEVTDSDGEFRHATLAHRYSDGPFALAMSALQAVGCMTDTKRVRELQPPAPVSALVRHLLEETSDA